MTRRSVPERFRQIVRRHRPLVALLALPPLRALGGGGRADVHELLGRLWRLSHLLCEAHELGQSYLAAVGAKPDLHLETLAEIAAEVRHDHPRPGLAAVRLYLALLREDLAVGYSERSREVAKYERHGGGWYRNQREEEQMQAAGLGAARHERQFRRLDLLDQRREVLAVDVIVDRSPGRRAVLPDGNNADRTLAVDVVLPHLLVHLAALGLGGRLDDPLESARLATRLAVRPVVGIVALEQGHESLYWSHRSPGAVQTFGPPR
jgi:hypothetical protein